MGSNRLFSLWERRNTWKLPESGLKLQKLPCDPKELSTSGKAEQNLPRDVFSGDAKHSRATPRRFESSSNTWPGVCIHRSSSSRQGVAARARVYMPRVWQPTGPRVSVGGRAEEQQGCGSTLGPAAA